MITVPRLNEKTGYAAACQWTDKLGGAMGEAVERGNKTLSTMEKVRRTVLTPEGFTTDNGMLTPTLKIRRHVIREKYGATLEALYGN